MKFSISRKWSIFFPPAGELNVNFLRCSRLSRFWRKNFHSPLEIQDFEENYSFSSRLNEILQTDSLLESQNFERKFIFSLSILPSISLPILVRNHILLFGWILTSSILQKGKVFDKDSSVFLSNILISVNKGTLVMVFSDTQSLFWNWTSEVRTPLCGGDNF